MKTKYIRAGNFVFMNNDLSKEIMVRSRLGNKLLKLKEQESRDAYKKQRNYCLSLLRGPPSGIPPAIFSSSRILPAIFPLIPHPASRQ